ncbi:hypothetical protein E0485_10485 [Paenibacillus albiflavus]|uniref:Uncharacterized protein n=1 Tax=Paenibacillus albiflavus TaxID=2545760 RepID=A0A4R4EGY2_9BACL|nr:hypothetical protein [Paenibacillus albiflavus]TCZ77415.1 hypothetical protein E0485_10485 [Paenibacillus albiflavus]
MAVMGVHLTFAVLFFAALVLGVLTFLRNVVTKDSVRHDLEFVWNGKFTREQIEFQDYNNNHTEN